MYPSEKSEKGQIINLILKNKAVHLINSNNFQNPYRAPSSFSAKSLKNSDKTFTSSGGGKWGKRGAESTQLAKSVRSRNFFFVFGFISLFSRNNKNIAPAALKIRLNFSDLS